MQKGNGDCFIRSFHIAVFGYYKGTAIPGFVGEPILVHGIVYHPETGWHIHGWVEDDICCYDFNSIGEFNYVPKPLYYRVGKVKTKPGQIFRYTVKEAEKKALEVGYYYFSKLPCKQ